MPHFLSLSYTNVSHPVNGRSRRMKALMEALGSDQVIIQPGEPYPGVKTVTLPRDLGKKKIGINWGIFNFFLPGNRRVAQRCADAEKPDLVALTSIWDLAPVQHLRPDCPMILDAHNVDAVAMEERYGPRHPFTRRVHTQEAKVLRAVDHIFCCSAYDLEIFKRRYDIPAAKLSVAPNGADIPQLDPDAPPPALPSDFEAKLGEARMLFFMGKLDYQPNSEALTWMRETLQPALEQRAAGRFLIVVCGQPAPADAANGWPGFYFAGSVPDLAPWLQRADACLAPLFSGSGTRLKILEYLAAGRPVIATPKAAEGIGATPDQHAVLVEAEAFADRILELDAAPEQAAALAAAGHAFAREHFDWEGIKPRWRSVIDGLLAQQ